VRKKKAKISFLFLTITAVVAIWLGFLKIYTHYHSVFRFGPFDYIVAIGAIVGGLVIFLPKSSIGISLVCIFFLTFEVNKAIIDFGDLGDVFLCVIAIFCLTIPIIKFTTKKSLDFTVFRRDLERP
jgi:hypothetical protein